MTSDQLAALHRAAFCVGRPWSAEEFSKLLQSPFVEALIHGQGFAITQTLAGETELLTLAVHPDHQRRGIANTLLRNWLDNTRADTAFLEVAADNGPALALYRKHGFAETGRRHGYYRRHDGPSVDAVLMRVAPPYVNVPESARKT